MDSESPASFLGSEPKNDDLVALYQISIQSAHYEGNLIWNVFASMCVTNSIMLAFIGQLWPREFNSASQIIIVTAVALVGLTVCRNWYRSVVRQFKFYEYWWNWAKEVESALLPRFKGMTRSLGPWVGGQPPVLGVISLDELGSESALKNESSRWAMDDVDRRHPNRKFAKLVPILFAILYVLIIAIVTCNIYLLPSQKANVPNNSGLTALTGSQG